MNRFQAFRCGEKSVEDAQFYRHEDCNANRGHLKEEEFFIVGDNSKYDWGKMYYEGNGSNRILWACISR